MSKSVNSSNLKKTLKTQDSVAVVLFAGEWCPDCRDFRPTWERWANGQSVPLYALEVARDGPEWKEWHLDEIPTVCTFLRGVEQGRVHGTITAQDLDDLLRK